MQILQPTRTDSTDQPDECIYINIYTYIYNHSRRYLSSVHHSFIFYDIYYSQLVCFSSLLLSHMNSFEGVSPPDGATRDVNYTKTSREL